jgi:hypothetical protein
MHRMMCSPAFNPAFSSGLSIRTDTESFVHSSKFSCLTQELSGIYSGERHIEIPPADPAQDTSSQHLFLGIYSDLPPTALSANVLLAKAEDWGNWKRVREKEQEMLRNYYAHKYSLFERYQERQREMVWQRLVARLR